MIETINVTIRCPECLEVQGAVVEMTEPWATRVHECEGCHYVIMESEWDEVSEKLAAKLKDKK